MRDFRIVSVRLLIVKLEKGLRHQHEVPLSSIVLEAGIQLMILTVFSFLGAAAGASTAA